MTSFPLLAETGQTLLFVTFGGLAFLITTILKAPHALYYWEKFRKERRSNGEDTKTDKPDKKADQ